MSLCGIFATVIVSRNIFLRIYCSMNISITFILPRFLIGILIKMYRTTHMSNIFPINYLVSATTTIHTKIHNIMSERYFLPHSLYFSVFNFGEIPHEEAKMRLLEMIF